MTRHVDTDADSPAPVMTRGDFVGLNLGYFIGGISTALICLAAHMSTTALVVAAAVMYSASSQLAVLSLLIGGASTVSAFATGLLVSLRFGIMAVALSPRLERSVPRRMLAAFLAVDPTVGMAMRERTDHNSRSTYWRIAPSMWLSWMIGIGLGRLLQGALDNPKQWGLDVVIPASLIGVLGGSLRLGRDRAVTAIAAALITIIAIPNTAAGIPVLLSLGAIAVGISVSRGVR